MENTKRCPFCGEEILAVAKKCKYCGEWLDEEHNPALKKKVMISCPICGEQVEEGTDICPYCHEKIGTSSSIQNVSDNKSLSPSDVIVLPSSSSIEKQPDLSSPSPVVNKINKPEVSNEKKNLLPSFLEYYFIASFFRHYLDFKGSISRKQFWMSGLCFAIISIMFGSLDIIFGTMYIFSVIYTLALLIPSIAIVVRRLHDIGKSGWWYFIAFVPIIGTIWLIVLLCKKGKTQSEKVKFHINDGIILGVTVLLLIFSIVLYIHRISNIGDTASVQTGDLASQTEDNAVSSGVSLERSEDSSENSIPGDAQLIAKVSGYEYYYVPTSSSNTGLFIYNPETKQVENITLEEVKKTDSSDFFIYDISKAFLSTNGQNIILITSNGGNGSMASNDLLVYDVNNRTIKDLVDSKCSIELLGDKIKVTSFKLVRKGDCEANNKYATTNTYYDLDGNLTDSNN